ncbi:MAG: HAD family phosphatase [Clostridiaceae bacterium]|nr:HAD family phosphatase [Clostridiaceae bacterium]
MIKAVLFDMDGVLIDSELIRLVHVQGIIKSMDIVMSDEEYIKFIGTSSHFMWSTIKHKYNLNHTLEELINKDRNEYFIYLSSPDTKITPIRGITELLKNLHENNIKMAVASSSPINVIEFIIESFKFNNYFNALVTGDYVNRSKPEPDIFLFAAEKLGVLPEECVVIEDSCNGVKAAKRAGMNCVGYRNLNSGNQDLSEADIIIDSFCDLIWPDLYS